MGFSALKRGDKEAPNNKDRFIKYDLEVFIRFSNC
jgi:hypothetical protein